jgi:hypothetical protein
MQRISGFLLVAVLLSFTACKSHDKKILLYASGNIQTDNSHTSITVADGTTHHEQELDFPGSEPVTLNIQSPQGKFSLNATDDGFYIANLKNDTVIGSYQHVGSDNGSGRMSQDAAKQKLDSLQKLLLGENVSDANRNYFILPGKIAKITTELRAKVFGPYTTIPGSFDAGSVPEIYKFYSIKEVREIVTNLAKMTK